MNITKGFTHLSLSTSNFFGNSALGYISRVYPIYLHLLLVQLRCSLSCPRVILNTIILPVLLLTLRFAEDTDNVERINQGKNERTPVLETRALNFRHAIRSEVDLVGTGQGPHGVEHIHHGGIAEHDRRLEDPEEPLVLEDGADVLHMGDVEARGREVLDRAVDRAHRDERAAAVQDVQRAPHLAVEHARPGAVIMKFRRQRDEASHERQLQDQRRLEQRLARVLLALGAVGVGDADGAVGRDRLDYGAHGDECREDAARMDGGLVGDVVEDAAEDPVVGDFVDGSSCD